MRRYFGTRRGKSVCWRRQEYTVKQGDVTVSKLIIIVGQQRSETGIRECTGQ